MVVRYGCGLQCDVYWLLLNEYEDDDDDDDDVYVCLWYTVQERLTMQIAEALIDAIRPSGVGVVVEATWVW